MPYTFKKFSRTTLRKLAPGEKVTEHGIAFERLANGDGLFTVNIMVDGERIYTLEKLFNVREGISRKDDKVPERYHEPLKYGPYKGEYIDEKKFKDMLDEYYEMSGLDNEGKPKPESLKRLQLDDEEELRDMASV